MRVLYRDSRMFYQRSRKTRSHHIVRIKGTESQAVGHSSCDRGRYALLETRDPNRNISLAMSIIFWDAMVTAMVMKHGIEHFVVVPIEVSNLLGWLSASNSARAPDGAA
jgi:hypothetical protein